MSTKKKPKYISSSRRASHFAAKAGKLQQENDLLRQLIGAIGAIEAGVPEAIKAACDGIEGALGQHWGCRVIAAHVAQTLGDAPNFVTLEVGGLEVTVRRPEGKTPAFAMATLRGDLEKAQKAAASLEEERQRLLALNAKIQFANGQLQFELDEAVNVARRASAACQERDEEIEQLRNSLPAV